jgi:alpha-beta hydrolase superfamily lysophospholipase
VSDRREFLAASAGAAAAMSLFQKEAFAQPGAAISGSEHWTSKRTDAGDVRLFLWRKRLADAPKGALVFVHGSSVQSVPAFDLQIPGQPQSSVMDWFARLGYDTWCFDCEGYGRSDKSRPVNADIACGADDLAAVSEFILKNSNQEKLFLYGSSSGALRLGLFAQRHPGRIRRIVLDALVYTGAGSPTLAERKKRLPQYRAANRRPIDREFVRSIFTRDGNPDAYDPAVVERFADQVLALDTSMPTGTYVDMSANLPVLDPAKIRVPTTILRGQWDGIATEQDVIDFFARLPNPDKQLSVMPGIAHTSLRSRNWRMVYDLVDACCSRAAPVYTG